MKADILSALNGIATLDVNYVNSLLCVLEAYMTYLPSSTATHELADISLYDHVKMTAAYANCIYRYLQEKQESDFKSTLLEGAKDFYQEKVFRLVSLDLSGIQKFIFMIHSEGALRVLRSRSFYLEILMEHMIDQLLQAMHLSRANLIYSGGGHCYILAPNTESTQKAITDQQKVFQSFFLDLFDVGLYIAAASVPCSARDLENQPEGSYSQLFRDLSAGLSLQKMNRYSPAELITLNRRKQQDALRECKICKTSSRLTAEGKCSFCDSMYTFSSDILYKDFFTVFLDKKADGIPLPGGMVLVAQNSDQLKKSMEADSSYVRTYGKNRFYTGKSVTTRLWIGDYTQKGKTTEEYAKESTGIDRIAVLRADVDDLGKAIVSGFESRYTSLSRTATFSRMMSLFFKHHINEILLHGSYSLTGKAEHPRNAAIVYSGGDDLFIVGSWDEIIELAVDISDKLKEFSQGTLTISAGIGIYDAKYPLSSSADEVALLENASKNYPDPKAPLKNAVTLFEDGTENHTYSWQEWKEEVIGEKYIFLEQFLTPFQEKGNTFLYYILSLIRGMEERINLARFAYALARLAPSDEKDREKSEAYQRFSRTMYDWVQDKKHRKQLVTAILMYVYLHREREGSNEAE